MDALFKIIYKISEDKHHQIMEETDLITDFGYDSLKFIFLISEIEETYQIEFDIDDIDLDKIRLMRYLIKLINKKVSEKNNE